MMNSKICYMYRDSANYKFYHGVVISGHLTLEDLKPYFHDHDFFIPSELGWPDLQPEPLSIDDHIWHKIYDVESTHEKPNFDLTAEKLIEKFKILSSKNWNEYETFKRKGFY